ncbi:MAG: DNA repair protein RecO [Gammaproteobacteria bacterium]|nr:DNA repair protein RecO [Gammaproteobacteria bacterium]
MNRISLQPAFILHARPYHDTSLLLDVFSREQGRVHLIAKGVRVRKSKTAVLLQPFFPLFLSWQGRTDLMTLTQVEPRAVFYGLQAEALLCGLYLNEMLVRLLQRADPCPGLFERYDATLKCLAQSLTIPITSEEIAPSVVSPVLNAAARVEVSLQAVLRLFEKQLLVELGYALPLEYDVNGDQIEANQTYAFIPALGFKRSQLNDKTIRSSLFSGACLVALHQENFKHQPVLLEMKRLLQLALAPLLGEKPLKSRECFVRSA